MKTRFEFDPATALDHLRDVDQGMGRLIERVGSLDLSANRNRSVFEYLARSIVYQQLSGKAAGTIQGRLQNLFQVGASLPIDCWCYPIRPFGGRGFPGGSVSL